jgi:hypothetical protein
MLRLIVLIIIALLILSFFGISLRTLVLSPTAQDNFAFVWQLIQIGWNDVATWAQGLGNSINQFVAHP